MKCRDIPFLMVVILIQFHPSKLQVSTPSQDDNSSSLELYYDYDIVKDFGKKTNVKTTTLNSIDEGTRSGTEGTERFEETTGEFQVNDVIGGGGVRDRKTQKPGLRKNNKINLTGPIAFTESGEDYKTEILFSRFFTSEDVEVSETLEEETNQTEDTTRETTSETDGNVLPKTPRTSKEPLPQSFHELEQEKYLFEKHECYRECVDGAEPMTCKYHFRMEWYHSMSKACYDCPFNLTDCYRPDCISADGVKRPLIVINRSLPGPAVEVCLGDKVIVDVENLLMEESTSIHWHGHHQRGSPYMDGVPFVTQCPIPPKSTFRYTYTASSPGTHFWHSHSGCQRADGAFGAFIVRKPLSQELHQSLYDLDLQEHTIIALDWSHNLGVAIFTAHHHSDGDNKPTTIQVNGRGMFKSFTKNGNSIYTPTASFTVTQGFRYRFRLINAGVMNCPIELSIDNHTMIVISSDGSDIHPIGVDSLVSYAGERWDFVVNAEKEVANYWIKFRGLMDCDERFHSVHQVAVLRYQGSDTSKSPSGEVSYETSRRWGLVLNDLNSGLNDPSVSVPELAALDKDIDPALAPLPDRKIILSYDFHPIDNPHYHRPLFYGFSQVPRKAERLFTPQLNHISLKLQPFPLLSQPKDLRPWMVCRKQDLAKCKETYCECTNIINIKLGEVVEIIMIDIGVTFDANHPFHLHGHPFRVVAMDRIGRNVTVEKILDLDAKGFIKRNLHSPPIKDTVTVPDGGYTIIRFQASNPGYWIFHCHIEFHVELGMALLFKVGHETEFPPVPKGFPTCGNFIPEEDSKVNSIENEIDFRDGLWTYNVSKEKAGMDQVISVVHWWPLVSREVVRRSSAPESKCQLHVLISTVLVISLRTFLYV